jgi:hypothetical protein
MAPVEPSTTGNLSTGSISPSWDRAINTLVPLGLLAAMLAYTFPFFDPQPGFHIYGQHSRAGLAIVLRGLVVFSKGPSAPLITYVAAFLLPLLATFVGVAYRRRAGWIGSAAPLVCSSAGLMTLGSAYIWWQPDSSTFGHHDPWGFGFFAAEVCFVIAAVASGARLIRRQSAASADAEVRRPLEQAASASQELLWRYRMRT